MSALSGQYQNLFNAQMKPVNSQMDSTINTNQNQINSDTKAYNSGLATLNSQDAAAPGQQYTANNLSSNTANNTAVNAANTNATNGWTSGGENPQTIINRNNANINGLAANQATYGNTLAVNAALKATNLTNQTNALKTLNGNIAQARLYGSERYNNIYGNLYGQQQAAAATAAKIAGIRAGAAAGGSSGVTPPGGSLAGWIAQAEKNTGVGNSSATTNALNTIIQHESSGNPNIVNTTDSNARAGRASVGLMQEIPTTYEDHRLSSDANNIRDPISNLDSGIRYILSRYGSIANTPGIRSLARGSGYVGY